MGEAVRPGKDGVTVVTARGEVVQTSIGGDGINAVAVVVAAAVVEVPEQGRRAVIFAREPFGKSELVEGAPVAVLAGADDRDGEGFASVAAARVLQAADEGVEAATVVIFLRQQFVLPAVLVIETLAGGMDEIGLAVARAGRIACVFEDAEVSEHGAQFVAFRRGQGEVVRAAGRTQVAVLVGGVVAVAFDAFGEEDVARAVAGELPQRG